MLRSDCKIIKQKIKVQVHWRIRARIFIVGTLKLFVETISRFLAPSILIISHPIIWDVFYFHGVNGIWVSIIRKLESLYVNIYTSEPYLLKLNFDVAMKVEDDKEKNVAKAIILGPSTYLCGVSIEWKVCDEHLYWFEKWILNSKSASKANYEHVSP